jgi:hypothetical protein
MVGVSDRFTELAEAEHSYFSSHSAHLGRRRARNRKLLCQPILTPHTVSVVLQPPTRVPSGLTVPNSIIYCIFSGGALSHHRRAYHAVGLFPPRVSPALRPQMNASYIGCLVLGRG